MPLIKATLENGLRALFENPPLLEEACAAQWASAMVAYATPIVPPSAAVAGAQGALQSALSGMSEPDALVGKLQAALTAFAGTVGGGMAPFVPTPPPVPCPLAFLQSLQTLSPDEAASQIATAIDTWMKTGIATSPAGVATSWS